MTDETLPRNWECPHCEALVDLNEYPNALVCPRCNDHRFRELGKPK